MLLKDIRELRCLLTRYVGCVPFWNTIAGAIDGLLGLLDSSSLWVRCDDVEIRTAFRDMGPFRRELPMNEAGRKGSANGPG